MPSATASGADASSSGGGRHREHNQGNQDRSYTPEQKAAVLRIRRCQATAFYEILDIERTVTSGEVKKAYRKQSLLTHPDKNSHPNADDAFKMVSRAFGVLGDKEKREKFDRYGTDPDSRFGSGGGGGGGGAGMNNPFASRAGGGGGGGMGGGWEEDMSPEEMFRRFFGGGGGGGGFPFGGFDTGPQFVFNMGGGPGFRVHQFGGARPRTRPRQAGNNAQQPQQDQSLWSTVVGLLPILILFVLPLLSSLFSGEGTSQPAMPRMVFDAAEPPYTLGRRTPNNVKYYVDPRDFTPFQDNAQKLSQLDSYADVTLVRTLRAQCEREMLQKQRLKEEAQGWIFQDADKMEVANRLEMRACDRLERMNYVVRQ
ncbi:er associated chaperone [Grosmannia clavigera kw1407]|uniref:Er associated chaperone n=1 Tax=Grosmannia clavigera (strain kw1407 / UAMH 11150) TaxID=655863 RepID=F0X6R1_GROCL|nr:er associated chaperone [Grosmannia clavigera kw1407]EFX06536.1 er associated chaperone [Grosmannia clavigera kw1407]